MALVFQPATLAADSPDSEATIVFRDGRLLAVLSRLSDIHDDLQGFWFVEAAFTRLPPRAPQAFASLSAFEPWIVREAPTE